MAPAASGKDSTAVLGAEVAVVVTVQVETMAMIEAARLLEVTTAEDKERIISSSWAA